MKKKVNTSIPYRLEKHSFDFFSKLHYIFDGIPTGDDIKNLVEAELIPYGKVIIALSDNTVYSVFYQKNRFYIHHECSFEEGKTSYQISNLNENNESFENIQKFLIQKTKDFIVYLESEKTRLNRILASVGIYNGKES